MASSEMRAALQREQARLNALLASLERDWNNAPKLLVLSVLAVPVGVAFGLPWALLMVVLVVSLVATALYLVGVRRREYRHELDEVERRLASSGDSG